MFLDLKHKKLDAYLATRKLTKLAYLFTNMLPQEKKFNMTSQIRRAALSVKLNLAEGASRKSANERKRFLEISRGSLIEIDAAIETAVDLNNVTTKELATMGEALNKCFAMISNMILKTE